MKDLGLGNLGLRGGGVAMGLGGTLGNVWFRIVDRSINIPTYLYQVLIYALKHGEHLHNAQAYFTAASQMLRRRKRTFPTA